MCGDETLQDWNFNSVIFHLAINHDLVDQMELQIIKSKSLIIEIVIFLSAKW